jgi:hypothetical protein
LFKSDFGITLPNIFITIFAKKQCRPLIVPSVNKIVAYTGETRRTLRIRYDQGPSCIVPTIPTFLSRGLTKYTLDEPVIPKTQNIIAASL